MRTREETEKMFEELGEEFNKEFQKPSSKENLETLKILHAKRQALLWAMKVNNNLTAK